MMCEPTKTEGTSDNSQSKIVHVLEEYLEQLERGDRASPSELSRRFPELEGRLSVYLEKLDLLHGAALGLGRPALDDIAVHSEAPDQTARLGDFQIVREMVAAAWGSFTKPSKYRLAGAWR